MILVLVEVERSTKSVVVNKNMENFEEEVEKDFTTEENFNRYLKNLDLKLEDLNKNVLDIGSGSGDFARWAKEKGIESRIESIDPRAKEGVKAVAENIPFKNESFDLIVSVAAIPNIYIGEKESGEKVTLSFDEMNRVLRYGGEIRLGNVLIGEKYEPQQKIKESIEEKLTEFEEMGFEIEMTRKPSGDIYEYDEKNNPKEILAEAYLVIIRKKV